MLMAPPDPELEPLPVDEPEPVVDPLPVVDPVPVVEPLPLPPPPVPKAPPEPVTFPPLQTPLLQVPSPQEFPQEPQFAALVNVFSQAAPHCVRPPAHVAEHAPWEQTSPAPHVAPQTPQFPGSLRGLTQYPLQASRPVGHREFESVGEQALPMRMATAAPKLQLISLLVFILEPSMCQDNVK